MSLSSILYLVGFVYLVMTGMFKFMFYTFSRIEQILVHKFQTTVKNLNCVKALLESILIPQRESIRMTIILPALLLPGYLNTVNSPSVVFLFEVLILSEKSVC